MKLYCIYHGMYGRKQLKVINEKSYEERNFNTHKYVEWKRWIMSLIRCILTLHSDGIFELSTSSSSSSGSGSSISTSNINNSHIQATTEAWQRAATSIYHLHYFRDLIKKFHGKWICSLCKRTKLKRSSLCLCLQKPCLSLSRERVRPFHSLS